MSYEIRVLRALLRLARRRRPATLEELRLRVGGDERALRRALGVLARAELVQPGPEGPRLSLVGLAVAVASAPQVKRARDRRAAVAPLAVRRPPRRRAA